MERKIILAEDVEIFMDELLFVLYEKGYFPFLDNAIIYVKSIVYYAKQYIGILPGRNAPPYFDRYGDNMKYITYRANKATLWYIFYQEKGSVFIVRHITNNHVAAHYF